MTTSSPSSRSTTSALVRSARSSGGRYSVTPSASCTTRKISRAAGGSSAGAIEQHNAMAASGPSRRTGRARPNVARSVFPIVGPRSCESTMPPGGRPAGERSVQGCGGQQFLVAGGEHLDAGLVQDLQPRGPQGAVAAEVRLLALAELPTQPFDQIAMAPAEHHRLFVVQANVGGDQPGVAPRGLELLLVGVRPLLRRGAETGIGCRLGGALRFRLARRGGGRCGLQLAPQEVQLQPQLGHADQRAQQRRGPGLLATAALGDQQRDRALSHPHRNPAPFRGGRLPEIEVSSDGAAGHDRIVGGGQGAQPSRIGGRGVGALALRGLASVADRAPALDLGLAHQEDGGTRRRHARAGQERLEDVGGGLRGDQILDLAVQSLERERVRTHGFRHLLVLASQPRMLEQQIELPETGEQVPHAGSDLDRPRNVLHGLAGPSGSGEHRSSVQMVGRTVRRDLDRRGVGVGRVRQAIEFFQGGAQVVPGQVETRVQFQRTLEAADRLLTPVCSRQGVTQVVPDLGVVRAALDRRFVGLGRLGVATQVRQGVAHVVPGPVIVGRELRRSPVPLDGLVQLAQCRPGVGQVVPDLVVVGRVIQRVEISVHGLVHARLDPEGVAQIEPHLVEVRPDLQGSSVAANRLVEPAELQRECCRDCSRLRSFWAVAAQPCRRLPAPRRDRPGRPGCCPSRTRLPDRRGAGSPPASGISRPVRARRVWRRARARWSSASTESGSTPSTRSQQAMAPVRSPARKRSTPSSMYSRASARRSGAAPPAAAPERMPSVSGTGRNSSPDGGWRPPGSSSWLMPALTGCSRPRNPGGPHPPKNLEPAVPRRVVKT